MSTVNDRLKNESFWVGACSDWALNQTWALIKKNGKNENNRKYQASKILKKNKIISKIDHKNSSFPFAQISA